MNSQRLSLSSSVFAGRIKKYDTYQHDSQTSQRTPPRPQSKVQASVQLKKIERPRAPIFTSANHLKQPANVTIFEHSRPSKLSETSVEKPMNVHKIALTAIVNSKTAQNQNTVIARQFHPPAKKSRFSRFKVRASKTQMAFYGLGLAVFMFAGLVSVQTLLTNKEAKEQISVLGEQTFAKDDEGVVESTDGSEPAEAEVSPQAISSYRVDPELPRYLRIPDIGVNARIKHTGVDKKGAVDSPKNVNDVSWFNETAVPGSEVGSSLLLGHVSGWTAPGIFKKIDKLQAGMRIEVEKGRGEKLVYEVTRGEKIPVNQVDMSKILGTEVAGQHDLKLMTCSGKYNKTTKQFEDRYVVYAKILR